MTRLLTRSRDVVGLVREGHGRELLDAVGARLHSEFVSYGLRRDLSRPFEAPPAKIELAIRPLAPGDRLSFLDPEPSSGRSAEVIRRNQLRLLAAGIPTCWIATGPYGEPCYMQWLIGPRENARIKSEWGGAVPELGPEEALLEGAYTPDSHRGLGIMAHAMARIAEKARDLGARWVITFVAADNVPSLKGCKRAGFEPYVERRLIWRLGRRRAVFTPLPEGFRFPYELEGRAASSLSRPGSATASAERSTHPQPPPV